MNPGDLVLYNNPRWIPKPSKPIIGIILYEQHGISVETKFFQVLLENGYSQLIPDSFLNEMK